MSAINYLVVSGDIFMQSAQHDHGHHAREKEDDDERVEDAKPLDVRVWHRLQDVIPTRRPFYRVVRLKSYILLTLFIFLFIK